MSARDIEPELAYFRLRLAREEALTSEQIAQIVKESPFPLNDEEVETVVRLLEAEFDIEQDLGSAVTAEFKPWLKARRLDGTIKEFYWPRLRKYYMHNALLPAPVVATLDQVTDEILDYCGNPDEGDDWSRRGMVMGHVQSGKTTNYSALICKASDAGYQIIILLAGLTNSLRRQTQERLDETFLGRSSLYNRRSVRTLSIVRFGEAGQHHRFPVYGTSREKDFSTAQANGLGLTLSAIKEPILFVVKKNKSVLERLRDWLEQQHQVSRIPHTLLLIDDEADNASINTSSDPTRVTAINRAIRAILALFRRSTYVGYTATPFANIFIDADSDNEMLADDLFPRHFIKALDPPSNYVGARRIFADGGDLREKMLRVVEDYPDYLPLNHKRDHQIPDLPPSLYTAMRVFVISRAIRVVRGQSAKHCSMMINVSRFNDIQDSVYGKVYEYLQLLRAAIEVHAGNRAMAQDNSTMRALIEDFEDEFGNSGVTVDALLPALVPTVKTMEVRTVNMRGGQLDFSNHTDPGLHVIAIGGLALSRGLTLEGLTVSYILRNASAADTLMQMARWFGYRPDYEDICRLYLPESAITHYEFVNTATEELRSEIKRMEVLGSTPDEFGLKVRHSPAAIRITAANKMRAASSITIAQDYQRKHVEGYAIPNDDDINQANVEVVREFLRRQQRPEHVNEHLKNGEGIYWRGVEGRQVLELLSKFRHSQDEQPDLMPIQGSTSLVFDYIADRIGDELSRWDVVIPVSSTARNVMSEEVIEGLTVNLRERHAGRVSGNSYRITAKNRVANPGDQAFGLDKATVTSLQEQGDAGDRACCGARAFPLMLIHFMHIKAGDNDASLVRIVRQPAVTLSFCFPGSEVPAVERRYQVNPVYRRQMELFASEEDDDEPLIVGDDNE